MVKKLAKELAQFVVPLCLGLVVNWWPPAGDSPFTKDPVPLRYGVFCSKIYWPRKKDD